jgi:hypothetical protein
MSFTQLKNEYHIARKNYNCDAYSAIFDRLSISDLTEDEQVKVKAFEANGRQINICERYNYSVGVYYGDFIIFRANLEMLEIYFKYECYEE